MMIFYLFIAKNALPSYYYAWSWALCILAGIGVSRLLTQPGSGGRAVLPAQQESASSPWPPSPP
ncbi:hypothetical protein [Leifsonia xyli]|uniref:hypothetical protein n=1 Tax=Leifsonia xyli TaxID=1575 RepID=UPI003D67D011